MNYHTELHICMSFTFKVEIPDASKEISCENLKQTQKLLHGVFSLITQLDDINQQLATPTDKKSLKNVLVLQNWNYWNYVEHCSSRPRSETSLKLFCVTLSCIPV